MNRIKTVDEYKIIIVDEYRIKIVDECRTEMHKLLKTGDLYMLVLCNKVKLTGKYTCCISF